MVNRSTGVGPSTIDLHETLQRFREQGQLPGLAVAVWRGHELLAAVAAGLRKHDNGTPVTVDDRWHLGSNTKTMTATLVGLLVDRGVLRFEDRLGDLLAGLQTQHSGTARAEIHPRYADVTVEQLLQHRGGAPENPSHDLLESMRAGGTTPTTSRAETVCTILSNPPAEVPGQYAYSNTGYMILAAVLEQRCQASWESLMRTELFDRLEMRSAGFGTPGADAMTDQPWGHSTLEPIAPDDPCSDNPPAFGPAGTVHCTLADWGKFLSQHLAGARGEPTILTSSTVSRLHQPLPGSDYAAGWITGSRDWAKGPVLAHLGSNTLWTANTWLAPEKNLAFAVVTNRGDDRAHQTTDEVVGWLVDAFAMG